jgi:N-acetylglucosamine-6-phosphate deacetylase
MATHTLTARTLLHGIGIMEYPVVTIKDGLVTRIDQDPNALAAATDILAPAFFDIHTHGAVGHDVMSASPSEFGEMQRFLATHGVGHYLPTTVTAPVDTILHALERLADAIERAPEPQQARPVGIHLEGPFLSHAKRGVHPTEFLVDPTPELLDRFQTTARGHIKLVTIAPELPGALDTIAYAKTLGIRASLGHSNAVASEALAAIDAGATSATHTFNAMRTLDHREAGLLGITLDDNRLFAELICDGVHVDPAIVRLWWKAKGAARGILITDAMSAAGMPDGNYSLGGLAVTVREGCAMLTEDLARGKETLAGSLLTMDRAVANFRQFTDVHTLDAARLSSANPAIMLGQTELIRIAPGSPANLVHLDAHGNLLATYIHGKRIPASPR